MTETQTIKTATIVRRERTGHVRANNWQGGVQYEWLTTFFRDGEQWTTAVSRTRKEARERVADLGYTEVAARTDGVDFCFCGCKYWTAGRCFDCGGTDVDPDR